MIINVQEATRSSSCAAEACEQDAEPRSRLCWRCAKKDSVRLHVQPERMPDGLRCATCKADKDDDDFSKKSDAHHRRYRHHECKACAKLRRDRARANPEYLEQERARQRARTKARRLKRRALKSSAS